MTNKNVTTKTIQTYEETAEDYHKTHFDINEIKNIADFFIQIVLMAFGLVLHFYMFLKMMIERKKDNAWINIFATKEIITMSTIGQFQRIVLLLYNDKGLATHTHNPAQKLDFSCKIL